MSLSSPEWYAAVSLTERVARLRKQNLSTPPSEQALQKAQRYLARWRAQTPFNQSDYFAQRLALLEVREDELLDLLSQPLDTLQHHFEAPPRWLQQLDDAFQRYDSADWAAQARQNQDDRLGGLLAITSPLVQAGTARLRAGVRALAAEHDTVPFDPRSIDRILMAPIANGLMTMVSRILVFEMQLTALNRPLQGDTPEARFDDFVQRLGDKTYALELLRLYPVLAQRLVTYVDNWVSVRLEFLRRLCADQAALRAAFAPQRADIGRLVALKGDLGDRHRGGRSVMIARFDSGLQVVYKPKPMQVDVAFQSLLGWFNARQGERPFRQARLVARDTYGWIEFFETAPCQSEAEVARFYWRMGAYLAILYSLDAADFHAENIIAVGEQPMLIDLETLFHVYFGDYPVENAAQAAEARLRTAVLKIGMLPQKIWGNKDGVAVDVSGLGAPRRQPAPRKTLVWDRPGTDEMRAKFEFVDFEMQSQHRPVLNGREVELGQYADAIYAGFEATYRLIAGQRAAYAALVAQLFADVEVRILARPTQLYTMLLMQANHPDLQRDSLPLNQLFDKLWLDVRHNPKLKQLIPSEMRDLERGDVPLFTTRPHSRHAWDSQGRQIDDCFELSGLDVVRQRIAAFGEADLREQLWLMRTTLAPQLPPAPHLPLPAGGAAADLRAALLEAACAAGDAIEARAVRHGKGAGWLVYSMSAVSGWSAAATDLSMYDGLAGIALFYAYLGQVSGQARYTALAESALHTLRARLPLYRPVFEPIGGFEGWGSVVYCLTHLGVMWQRPALLDEAEALVETLAGRIGKDDRLDVIAGAAGAIAALLTLHRQRPAARTLAAAVQCGEHLLARAEAMPVGVGWKNHIARRVPLTGFSHGTAGMAWALLQLAAETGEARFRATALEALAYERSLFRPAEANWRDLRLAQRPDVGPEACGCGMAWCHGAPGIGLGRLLSLPYLDTPEVRAEIETAVQTTLAQGVGAYHPGFGPNYSLCHGDFGNLETLLEAARRLPEYAHLRAEVEAQARAILAGIAAHGWLCGVPQGVETPGLMTGMAGIGYGLLRLAAPERVPSVLGLQPPVG